jgi:hypothetical protein
MIAYGDREEERRRAAARGRYREALGRAPSGTG